MTRAERIAAFCALISLCGPIASCSRHSSRDVVLVTIDTLRADRLGCYGHPGRFTPTLDGMASRGVLFEQTVAPVPLTLPSHASLLVGRYPDSTGVRNNGSFSLPAGETTLAEVLHRAGYATGAVIGAFPLASRFGLSRGFDVYDEELPTQTADPERGLTNFYPERDARAVTDRALEIWKGLGKSDRRFLWVHYFDPHAPYAPPESFATRHSDQPYDGEVEFVDDQLGRLLAAVRRDSPKALVAVLSDHGESLGEHGEKTHGIFIYESTLRVPFILEAPGLIPSGRRIASPVSLVDVVPTVLGLLRIATPAGVEGKDLLPVIEAGAQREGWIYAESLLPLIQFRFSELTMIRRGSLKYINAPAPELYDLARDPAESSNLHGADPRESDLARELASRLSSADASASTRAAGVVDSEAEAKLRSLGYASGGTVRRSPGEGRGRDPKTATDYMRRYDRAVALFTSGDFALGVERLRELLPEAPENYMARFQIAIGLAAMKRWPESEEELSKVVRDAPEFVHGVLMLAEVQRLMGKTEEAIRNYRAASASVPWSPEPHAALARYLASVGRVNEAATAYEEAIRLDPNQKDFPRALLGLRLNHDEAPRAVEEFRALASRFPASASLWTCLAVAQRRTGDTRGALDSLERALAIEPWRATSRVQLGETLLDAKAPDRAEEAFRRALQEDPAMLQARLGLGRALLAQDRIADADAVLDAIVRERPRFAAPLTVRGQYWAARDDRGRAGEFFRRALRADPTSQEAWEGLRNLGETP